MPPIEFTASGRGTIGLEWEVALVDLATRDLSSRAGEVLELVGGRKDGPIRGEYLTSMVELVTGVHETVPSAIDEMRGLLGQVVDAAASLNLGVLAAGTHPFARSTDVPVVQNDRYAVVSQRNAYWGRRMTICGTHIHVGVPAADLALPVVHGLARFYPYLLALSASSPFYEGEDTGFASHRTMLFQQLPTNGLPEPLESWGDFEAYAEELTRLGMISIPTEIRWDVRPAPRFGTVENRAPDAVPTLEELGCLAAWSQCLADVLMSDEGGELGTLPSWLVRENKWRAARYGLEADVITPVDDARIVPARVGVRHWLDRLRTPADRLGCTEYLLIAQRILDEGASYQRQRRVAATASDDLTVVVDALLDETRRSLTG